MESSNMGIELYDCQKEAIKKMKNGCILCGSVGSGKSRTALGYYYKVNYGDLNKDGPDMHEPMDLYIITTAKKRDSLEWELEMAPFLLSTDIENCYYHNKVVVDSWNNIKKYRNVQKAFFIFDEQRVVGYGAWSKTFIKIAKENKWVLLSATPGDTWTDYIPVFIANGFYKNKTEFQENHIIYKPFTTFPQILRYINTGKLVRLRDSILVNIKFQRPTVSHHIDVPVSYDRELYQEVSEKKWDPYEKKPLNNASALCLCWRKVVNSDITRLNAVKSIIEEHSKVIIFYNFNYEEEALKAFLKGIQGLTVAEWNGHKHEPLPTGEKWAYLVQYAAGSEGWNCITTDTTIFFSANYSYRAMTQASGRIDRANTPYRDLYFYHLRSRAGIDLAINGALHRKKNFNESSYVHRKVA